MKANKFVAVALTALALVGLNACKDKDKEPDKGDQETELALDQTSVTLEVGKTATLTATVEATWESSDAEVAKVEGNGKSATITAVKAGSAVITAKTAGGQAKTCVVKVNEASGGGEGGGGGQSGASVKGSQIWPVILDGVTLEANKSKMVASFQPNDVDQFLYVWDNTYEGGTATGKNFSGNTEGYTALIVTSVGWSGCGFFLAEGSNGAVAAEALRAAIVANPDDYFLHMAIKSTDQGNHTFYFMNSDQTKFVLGSEVFDGGFVFSNFDRDGAWHEFDIPISRFANVLSSLDLSTGGNNMFVALSGGTQGVQLNLDAVYFYKK